MGFWKWFWAFVQTAEWCAQAAHVFSGMAVVLALSLWIEPVWAAVLFMGVYACPKEIVIDAAAWGENHGAPDFFDLAMYGAGALAALGLLAVAP